MRISDWSSDVCSSDLRGCTASARTWPLHLLCDAVVHGHESETDACCVEHLDSSNYRTRSRGRCGVTDTQSQRCNELVVGLQKACTCSIHVRVTTGIAWTPDRKSVV